MTIMWKKTFLFQQKRVQVPNFELWILLKFQGSFARFITILYFYFLHNPHCFYGLIVKRGPAGIYKIFLKNASKMSHSGLLAWFVKKYFVCGTVFSKSGKACLDAAICTTGFFFNPKQLFYEQNIRFV